MLAGSASINAAAPGFLEGHLKIVSLNEVEPANEMSRQNVTAELLNAAFHRSAAARMRFFQ
jgi:hypothetical protein